MFFLFKATRRKLLFFVCLFWRRSSISAMSEFSFLLPHNAVRREAADDWTKVDIVHFFRQTDFSFFIYLLSGTDSP